MENQEKQFGDGAEKAEVHDPSERRAKDRELVGFLGAQVEPGRQIAVLVGRQMIALIIPLGHSGAHVPEGREVMGALPRHAFFESRVHAEQAGSRGHFRALGPQEAEERIFQDTGPGHGVDLFVGQREDPPQVLCFFHIARLGDETQMGAAERGPGGFDGVAFFGNRIGEVIADAILEMHLHARWCYLFEDLVESRLAEGTTNSGEWFGDFNSRGVLLLFCEEFGSIGRPFRLNDGTVLHSPGKLKGREF